MQAKGEFQYQWECVPRLASRRMTARGSVQPEMLMSTASLDLIGGSSLLTSVSKYYNLILRF